MATTISLKNSVTTSNTPSSLAQGEVAINVTDKKVWVGNAATTPVLLVNGGSDGVFTSVTDSGLTNTRLTYAGTGGLLKDSASITTDGTTITAGGFSGPHNGTVGATTPNTGAFTTLTATNFNAASTFGFKNRIINGGMVLDQRNAGASVTPANGQYLVDRFVFGATQASKFTAQQTPSATETGYATRIAAGFTNYLALTVSSAVTVGSTDRFNLFQPIEGFNTADLVWGTANAKTVTLSFLVYSSLTGTFGGSILNGLYNYSYPFTYTISSANTWTQISVTIPGPTSGTWYGATNGTGVSLALGLGVGSSLSGTAGSWSANGYYSATGATSVVGTNGATFYITGVQLETGSVATTFDYRDYGRELILCQRYYQKSFDQNIAPAQNTGNYNGAVQYAPTLAGANYMSVNVTFPVTMRAAPTVTYYSPGAANAKWYNRSLSAASGDAASLLATTGSNGVTIINNPQVAADNLAQVISVHYTASIEL